MEMIVWSDVDDVAHILSHSNGPQELAAGFQYPEEERSRFTVKTSDRNNDADVVALKAIAKSVLDSGDTYKLARVMWWSIYPFGELWANQLITVLNFWFWMIIVVQGVD